MFTPDDLDDLARIFEKPGVMKYLGLDCQPLQREETEIALTSIIKNWELNNFGRWAVISKESGDLIGCAGFRSYEGLAELFYLLDEPYWGKGLATEIAHACLQFGFNERHFNKIVAFIRPENFASLKVLEKIGMRFVQEITIFGVFAVQYEIHGEDYLRQ
jgi:ribosomal-protein-alanine N-acetyltransferase